MKTFISILVFLIAVNAFSQEKYYTKNGHIKFFSHAPLEDITASNDQVASFLDMSNGEFTFALLMRSFEFEKALMQEHFNENYVESDQFPKSTFEGKVLNLEKANLAADGIYPVKVKGNLTIHGVTQEIEVEGELAVRNKTIGASSKFIVKPEDYNIKIPKAVRNNIAKEIEVTVRIVLNPYNS